MTLSSPVLRRASWKTFQVALRAFSPAGDQANIVGVSIDPTREGLANLQQYLARVSNRVRPGVERQLIAGMKEALGMQNVTIKGIPPKTHFAQVLVEADYRMKLISIGLENPRTKIASWVSRANPATVARNALQRWYFTPNYERVVVSNDRLAMQLDGPGVKLVSESEVVNAAGVRNAAKASASATAFAQGFTKNYPSLAQESPVYAQMRNLFDMLIAAAYIQQQDFYGQASWDLGVLADEENYPIETYIAPVQVETAVNALWKGRTLMTPIGGGVDIRPLKAIDTEFVRIDQAGKTDQMRKQIELPVKGQWWWD